MRWSLPMGSDLKLLGCPFCGKRPSVEPKNWRRDGNAWAAVQCVNKRCPSYDPIRGYGVRVRDGQDVADERGSDAYKQCAIAAWNTRSPLLPEGVNREAFELAYSAGWDSAANRGEGRAEAHLS